MVAVLVTGGAGYIGSVLCEELIKAGNTVTVLDNLSHGQSGPMHLAHQNKSLRFVKGDVRDKSILQECIRGADVIIPLAAIVGAPACSQDPVTAQTVNFDSIELLLNLRSKSQLILFPTTNSGYGTKSGNIVCDEDTPLEPISLYGTLKVEAEKRILEGGNSVSFRLATVFGTSSRMRFDLLVNHFVYAALTDRYLVIFEKDFMRNYVHIRDVAAGFIFALNNSKKIEGKPFNLGNSEANLSKANLAELIKKSIPDLFIHYSEIGSDPDKRNYVVSNERLKLAGFEAKISLETGIKEIMTAVKMLPRGLYKNV